MQDQIPSRTAWRVAARRAAHQVFDDPRVFEDPLALRILGQETTTHFERHPGGPENTRMARTLRAFMAVRSRFAEDQLALAVARGVDQYVILGAGLDTFAYRNPFLQRIRVFEVDHPATQAWKRDLLGRAGIAIPKSLTYAAADFEKQTLVDALQTAGFDRSCAAFFSWLGVTMYLARETVMAVFRFIATLPPDSGVVFDYGLSSSMLGPLDRFVLSAFARRVAAVGEPWTTFFAPSELTADLRTFGFRDVEDLGPQEMNGRYFSGRTDGLKVGSLAHLMKAIV